MVDANLLPGAHVRALARRDRAARWVTVIVCTLAVLVFLAVCSRQYTHAGRSGLERRAAAAAAEKANLEKANATLTESAGRVQAALTTARSIADHPDWSVLLSLVASLRGDDIEVDQIALGPRKPDGKPEARPEGKAAAAKSAKGVWVRLSGSGRDHQAIAQFALRLESAGLFDRVGLSDARKTAAEPGGLVGFEIEAFIDEAAPVTAIGGAK